MKPEWIRRGKFYLGIVCGLAVTWVLSTRAQYNLSQYVIADGGGQASGGGWTLNATLGEPAVGTATGGGFVLNAGFWSSQMQSPPKSGLIVYKVWKTFFFWNPNNSVRQAGYA